MKELKIEIPEGYEIDKEKSSFEKIVFKKKAVVNCWEDLKNITGVYINDISCFIPENTDSIYPHNKNIFLNEKYAKSALALAQISQLLPYYDTDVDWKNEHNKYCIERVVDRLEIVRWIHGYDVLAFNTESEAEDRKSVV